MTPDPSTLPVSDRPDTGHGKDAASLTASVFSTIFSPLLVPTYGVAMALCLSVLTYLPAGVKWGVAGMTFGITCVLPLLAILALWRLKVISDPQLNNRTERTTPYVITGLCYLGCAFYLWRAHAPSWLWALMAGGALATLICIGVNTRWKISAHMAAMGGLVALAFRITTAGVAVVSMNVWLTVVVIMAGCVGTSRVLLQRHTLAQVLAGAATGFLCVYLISLI